MEPYNKRIDELIEFMVHAIRLSNDGLGLDDLRNICTSIEFSDNLIEQSIDYGFKEHRFWYDDKTFTVRLVTETHLSLRDFIYEVCYYRTTHPRYLKDACKQVGFSEYDASAELWCLVDNRKLKFIEGWKLTTL